MTAQFSLQADVRQSVQLSRQAIQSIELLALNSEDLDTFVQELTTGSRYAEYVELYQKWFGRNPPPQRFYTGAR